MKNLLVKVQTAIFFVTILLLCNDYTLTDASEPTDSTEEYDDKTDWSYNLNDALGPTHWSRLDKRCGKGIQQSPINIDLSEPVGAKFKKMHWGGAFHKNPNEITLSKNDRAVRLRFEFEDDREFSTISGGPIPEGRYVLDHVCFHWGPNNFIGSEHTVNGKRYPMEMHAVYRRIEYDTFEEALDDIQGVVGIVYFFERSTTSTPGLEAVVQDIHSLNTPLEKSISLKDLFSPSELLPAIKNNYVSYKGSLTTPPCSEVVSWIISLSPLPILESHLVAFRTLYANTPSLINNFRPVQKLHDREIFYVPKRHH